jgi:putative ABC transport system ATP-binding protein
MPDALVMEGVAKHFRSGGRRFSALRGVDLAVPRGELVVVFGRSGAGKTTLLSLAGGLDVPDEGRVVSAGEEISGLDEAGLERFRRDKVGWVFQSSGLHPLLTAAENVAMALRIQGLATERCRSMAEAALERLGLEARARHRAHELSGGEQLRVALARALVKSPVLLLADEPTGQLDTHTGKRVSGLIREATRAGVTVLAATHDQSLADLADRVVRIEDGSLVPAGAVR